MLPNIDQINTQNIGGATLSRRPENDKALEAYKTAQAENDRVKAAEEPPSVHASDPERDQVEISLSLTREEREAFRAALAAREDGGEMTEEEHSTLQKASERISGFIDKVVARNAENRERVEKAIGEWYSLITKGEHQGPVDLINLLRQADMGNLDDLTG